MTTETIPEVTVTRERTTRDLLRAATRYIEEHGWCQGVAFDGEGRVCIAGAIRRVAGMDDLLDEWSAFPSAFDALDRASPVDGVSAASWNDAHDRTEAEVLAALRAAADTAP